MKHTQIQKDNKGFTLVELIVSFAILVIVSLAVVGMMTTGMRFFRTTSSNIGLQYEYQTVMTQMREHIVDCNAGVAVEGNTLYIVSRYEDLATGDIIYETTVFTISGGTLYYMSPETNPIFPADIVVDVTDTDRFFEVSDRMTDFVISFIYGTSPEGEDIAVAVATDMGFQSGVRTYRATQDIALRNKVLTPWDEVTSVAGTYSDLQDLLDLTP